MVVVLIPKKKVIIVVHVKMNPGQPFAEDDVASNEADIREMDVLNGRGKVDHRKWDARKLFSFLSVLLDNKTIVHTISTHPI